MAPPYLHFQERSSTLVISGSSFELGSAGIMVPEKLVGLAGLALNTCPLSGIQEYERNGPFIKLLAFGIQTASLLQPPLSTLFSVLRPPSPHAAASSLPFNQTSEVQYANAGRAPTPSHYNTLRPAPVSRADLLHAAIADCACNNRSSSLPSKHLSNDQ